MAAREGGIRVDGKLCMARMSRPHHEVIQQSSASGRIKYSDGGTIAEAKAEVLAFINRHEIAGGARVALTRSDPKLALRVLRGIESTNRGFTEGLVHAELQKVSRSELSPELEGKVSGFVADTGLSPVWQDRLESVLLAQRPEEIEHVLDSASNRWFKNELCSKDNPSTWLLAQVHKFRKARTLGDIQIFCERFGFPDDIRCQMEEVTAGRARRLIQAWQPAARGSQKDRQNDFLSLLSQALKETRVERETNKRQVSAVASHARIIQEWSDEDEEVDMDDFGQDGSTSAAPSVRPPMRRRPESATPVHGGLYAAIDADWECERDEAAEGRPQHYALNSSAHDSAAGAQTGQVTGTVSALRSSQNQARRRKPKPTHFVLCVDTSGSMANQDCYAGGGYRSTRLEAVMTTCHEFITESVMNNEDVYSFVTFNEESILHFSCLKSFDALAELERTQPTSEKQTLYAIGIRGVEAAIRRDNRRLPTHVVFLSDGEPTDPDLYLKDLHVLCRRHPGDSLKIYTIGFGESAKVNDNEGDFTYLQQFASVGRGHFQRCGASLTSLKGAFTAVTSTISRTRSSGGRWTLERDAITGPSSNSQNRDSSEDTTGGGCTAVTQGSVVAGGSMQPTINENLEEDDEEHSSDEEIVAGARRGPPVAGGEPGRAQGNSDNAWFGFHQAQDRICDVDFEQPLPNQIFKDLGQPTLWRDFLSAQTSFKFDGKTFARKAAVQRVYLRHKPFMKGGMRLVYGMLLEKHKEAPDATESRMCAKRLFQDLVQDRGFQHHAAFCKSTAVAHYFARLFRSVAKVRLGFLDCHLYSPITEYENGYHFCGEAFLKGHFVKLNSNAGYVNETDYSLHSEIAQAFSHYTFHKSDGELLVVDLQGICGEDDGQGLYFLLTDPQVHSRGTFERFGPGDLGEQGVRSFFQKHKCGPLCQKLKLRKEYDLCDPTHVIKMPGTPGCVSHMCVEASTAFYQQLRNECRISSMTLPREAHSDWLDIRIWAARKGVEKADRRLQTRLCEYYEKEREVIIVEPTPNWTAAQWKQKLDAWRKESGTAIIPFPHDWEEDSRLVRELWLFAQQQDFRRWAEKNIVKALEQAAVEAQAGSENDVTPANEGQQVEAWASYQDNEGARYWYREPDGLWFYETDKNWDRFFDEACALHWWWNHETGLWFYEPG
eukprot:TRINITY_DN29440_c0_g1_i1.p1 TRINITY_DN29440_c0_g1~~TRINITY_DN29440_c0_g1_i1.p1  ORF type:complete len:1197 (-),score=231.02 TRINITY_DN29440_c0_g1_i1:162-3674(-)